MNTYEAPTLRVDGALSSHTLAVSPGDVTDLAISALGSSVVSTDPNTEFPLGVDGGVTAPEDGSLLTVKIS